MSNIIKRFGIEFFGTSQRVRIEDGFDNIGETDYDSKRGTQVFKFKDEATWEKHRRGIFEAHHHFDKPVPFFEVEIIGKHDGPDTAQVKKEQKVEKPTVSIPAPET